MCRYIFKGKTYTYSELVDYVSNTKDSLTDLSSDELKSIAEGKIPGNIKSISNRSYERLIGTINKQVEALRTRLISFETATERKGYIPKEETINRIKDLEDKLNSLEDVNKFFEIAKYVHNELEIIYTFLEGSSDGTKHFDMSKEEHIRVLLELEKQLDTYKDLATALPEFAEHDASIKEASRNIDTLFKDINESIIEKNAAYLENFMDYNSKQDMSKEDIKELIKESKDISIQELYLGGMSNSMDKLLTLLQKHVEEKRQEVYDITEKHKETIGKYQDNLTKLGITDHNWMLQKDNTGKFNGRFITPVNGTYYTHSREVRAKLKDSVGNKREYIIKPDNELTEADKKYNLELAKDKKGISEFLKAEHVNEDGSITDGLNHKYSQEFKDERSKFEQYTFVQGEGNKWVQKAFVEGSTDNNGNPITEEQYNRLYKLFRRKYYTEPKLTYMLKSKFDKAKNSYYKDGSVIQVEVTYVKPDYVEVITTKNGKPTVYADKDYHKLMNEDTAISKAKRDYYEFYVKTSNELLSKLPLDVQYTMKNKLFRVSGSLAKNMSSDGFGFMNMVKKSIRKFINPDIIFSSRKTDEQGNIVEDVPILFVGDFKNNEKLVKLNSQLSKLQDELRLNPKDTKLVKRITTLKNTILIEENKLTIEELELDLSKSLIRAAEMAENYDIMKQAETTLLVAKNMIKDKRFFNVDNSGKKDYIKGESNVQKRLDIYMRMIFYSNSEKNNNKIAKIIQNMNSYTAFKTLGLNPFSAINNRFMAGINNRIEAYGKQFGYNTSHMNRASVIKQAHVTGMAWMDKFTDKNPYNKVPKDKFQAMLKKFNWLEMAHSDYERGSFINELMFSGISAGEYLAQSTSAISKLLSIELTNDKGEKTNLWDVYDFKDGKVTIKEGYTFSDEQRRKLTVDIRNMNKIIHGNYSDTDKAALQESALGSTSVQFKKWMYNFGKNRFGNTYFDETTGDYQEGRYRTFLNFMRFLKAGNMRDFNSIKDAFKSLNDYEKSNLKKLQAEFIVWTSSVMLYYLFDAIAEGIDDDDEELKFVVNFLKRQSDRVGGELDAMINPQSVYSSMKNPFASLTTLKGFGEVLVQTTRLPLLYTIEEEEKAYYDKGPNKGKLKVYKEINDMIPVMTMSNQIDAIMNSGNYYFR